MKKLVCPNCDRDTIAIWDYDLNAQVCMYDGKGKLDYGPRLWGKGYQNLMIDESTALLYCDGCQQTWIHDIENNAFISYASFRVVPDVSMVIKMPRRDPRRR